EEIDLYFNSNDPMPPGIEEDDDDSERDIPILKELLDNYSLSLPNTELYDFDIPSPYRLPAKPPDGKDHEEYILQSIDEGTFKMGRCRDEIATGTYGPYLGLEQKKSGCRPFSS
nr:hypothetical protein [Tanacetum cinerariifolium]